MTQAAMSPPDDPATVGLRPEVTRKLTRYPADVRLSERR